MLRAHVKPLGKNVAQNVQVRVNCLGYDPVVWLERRSVARSGMPESSTVPNVGTDVPRYLLHVGAEDRAQLPISSMKVIHIARKAVAEYLISSKVRRLPNRIVVLSEPVHLENLDQAGLLSPQTKRI